MPQDDKQNGAEAKDKPLLEWAAALIGLLLTLALLGFIGWQAVKAPETKPPAIVVTAERVVPVQGGYVMEFVARNEGPSTAAAVQVEGTLKGGTEPVKSSVTIDHIPGQSERRGGLFFIQDPRGGQFEVRALGYARP